jgi:hypothetical protein
MSITRKLLIILALTSLMMVGMGFVSGSALASGTCTKYHTVKHGEYLVQIGRIYNVSWRYLADINHLANPSKIFPGQVLCVAGEDGAPAPPHPIVPPGYSGFPTFSIVSVVMDDQVTVQTYNLTPNDVYTVTMGPMGTRGIGGIVVKKVETGSGGAKELTFDIPSSLHGSYKISIRMESPTSHYFAYNWFYNNTTGTGGHPPDPTHPGYTGFPTFKILSVVRDDSVTVQTYNLTANDKYVVTMGPMGTQGIGGIVVDTVDSGSGGKKQYTFDTPSALYGSYKISIRMKSQTSPYYAYNWFYNNTAVDP